MGTMEEQINSIIANPIQVEPITLQEQMQDIPQVKALEEMSPEEMNDKAKEMGWNPDFNGPNKKDAKEFLEVAEKRAPLLLKDKKRLEQENEILRKSHDQLMKVSTETIARQKIDADKRIAELETVKKTARENLDVNTLEKAINEQDGLKQQKQQLDTIVPQIDPTVTIWAQQNADFVKKMETDPSLERYAEFIALSQRDALLKLAPAERFQKVMEQVIADRPEKFANPNQQQAPRTLTMDRTQTPNKSNADKISVATLPPVEKAAYEIILKAQRFKTDADKKAYEDRYLENYKVMNGIK